MKRNKLIISLLLVLAIMLSSIGSAEAYSYPQLSKEQKRLADNIAKECSELWEQYGVLPSVCVAQAFTESSLGKKNPANNYWGIRTGGKYLPYSSLEAGARKYCSVINLSYYKGAPFKKDYSTQLRIILDGGYCYNPGSYYERTIGAIKTYGFDKYDKQLFDKIKAKKRAEILKKKRIAAKKELDKRIKKIGSNQFKFVYDPSVPPYTIQGHSSLFYNMGTILVYDSPEHYMLEGIYNIRIDKGNEPLNIYELKTSDDTLVNKNVYIEYQKNSKG